MGRTFVTFEEASVLLKCTKRTVQNFVKRGQLRRAYVEGSVVLHRDEVEQLVEERGSNLPALNNKTLLECLSRIKVLETKVAVFQKITGVEEAPPLRPEGPEALKFLENLDYYLNQSSYQREVIDFWSGLFRRIDETTLDLLRTTSGRDDSWKKLFDLCLRLLDFCASSKTLTSAQKYQHFIDLSESKKRLRDVCLVWVELRGSSTQYLRKALGAGKDDLVQRLLRKESKS